MVGGESIPNLLCRSLYGFFKQLNLLLLKLRIKTQVVAVITQLLFPVGVTMDSVWARRCLH